MCRPDWSEAHLASFTMGTGSFAGVKPPKRDANHPPTLSSGLHMGWSYVSGSSLYRRRRDIVCFYIYSFYRLRSSGL